jgi:hypothetical protein
MLRSRGTRLHPIDSARRCGGLPSGIKRSDLCGDVAKREVGHCRAFSLLQRAGMSAVRTAASCPGFSAQTCSAHSTDGRP